MTNPPDDSALFPERFVPGEMHGLIEAEHLARYLWASTCVAGRRVLDAGCGMGYGSRILLAAGAASVTGVDIAQEAVDAASISPIDDLNFIVGDISRLPLEDASFDIAVCFEAIEHVLDQDGALDELRRVLTADGLLVISSPNREIYQEGNPHHTHEYSPEELHTGLSARFGNVRLERQQAWLASLVGDEEMLRSDDHARHLNVEVRKVATLEPGHETFTVALASDATLPNPSALVMLAALDELAAWRERARSAEDHLARTQSALEEAGTSYRSASTAYASLQESYENALTALEKSQQESAYQQRSLNHTSTLLAERSAALRLVTAELTASRSRETNLERALKESSVSLTRLRGSLSWRLTAPLRIFAGRGKD
jgi:ubiquinone/menaquinone biosynthesis C-methylase UbiE